MLFAQLIYVFKYQASGDVERSIALVHPFDGKIPLREVPKKDRDLGFIRVRVTPRKEARFVSVDSIIRGALVVEDHSEDRAMDRLVVDVVDGDMFLRLRPLVPHS